MTQAILAKAAIREALETMILSPSGWRGVFAASGNEEDAGSEINPAMGIIAAAGAIVFGGEVSPPATALRASASPLSGGGTNTANCAPATPPTILVGTDTRPTGATVADIMIRAFLASGCQVSFTGVSAAPEIMAYSKALNAAFAYISASHNPIGHNGIKFGVNGGVLAGPEAEQLIAALKNYLADENAAEKIATLLNGVNEDEVRRVYTESTAVKRGAIAAYRDFSAQVIGGNAENAVFGAIRAGLEARPLGIAADFNGSARTLSIDAEFFRSLGIGFHAMNALPGEIVHAIIPEGDSLEPCRAFLKKLHAVDPSIILGYVPDCDGDRGNLVIWDDAENCARALEAQEVFALACAAELAQLVWTGDLTGTVKHAVAVNGPTSMRLDRIAALFGVKVFRAEVGEANVVNLARKLRKNGYTVRILGEGSNGGNITHPSAVRDPLATIFALVKLLTIRSGGLTGKGLFSLWRERAAAGNGKNTVAETGLPAEDFTLADIIACLPCFYTTGVSAPEAKLQVTTRNHRLLKERYQAVFLKEWDKKKAGLESRQGITGWEARSCVGTEETRNLANFGDAETGGLKIVFKNNNGDDAAFIWMRGSKTEPVFRIMADAQETELERELIAWQRDMVREADGRGKAGNKE